ncbi:DNA adenine methylase [Mesorhizobium sp. ES1-1]|uniref:DNA adenine methylase n=1 Tax=Mesorhizobium sp. ES1-1 TaxID=2876629 RepID=UPI001CC97C39|nr:Dam family site-specific DNA-(adenine-N6)-methyltransferase [Mesorhizobium sp. ES1-1]MBZ9676099.1 Dam family site-specific DNA-(adenine-N6)-methyltransferase [Mesorhizobium sp. ES1-1]
MPNTENSNLPIVVPDSLYDERSRPFLRWAGSKQRLLAQIIPLIPKSFGRYYEPFLGSGALFFALEPDRATLSDVSTELVETWRSVRDHCKDLCDYLDPLKPSKELFYQIRSGRSSEYPRRAGEFLYLNKTCWNGLYRVNGKGEFNVPYGAPQSDFIFDRANLIRCSRLISKKNISILNVDFRVSLKSVREGDLVFLDPPYVTKHNFNGFRDWNEQLFSWADQERLAATAKRLADKGAYVVVSNADHPDVAELYTGFTRSSLERASTLASNAARRGRVTEALFRSF